VEVGQCGFKVKIGFGEVTSELCCEAPETAAMGRSVAKVKVVCD
jgi:hypothetical protein